MKKAIMDVEGVKLLLTRLMSQTLPGNISVSVCGKVMNIIDAYTVDIPETRCKIGLSRDADGNMPLYLDPVDIHDSRRVTLNALTDTGQHDGGDTGCKGNGG